MCLFAPKIKEIIIISRHIEMLKSRSRKSTVKTLTPPLHRGEVRLNGSLNMQNEKLVFILAHLIITMLYFYMYDFAFIIVVSVLKMAVKIRFTVANIYPIIAKQIIFSD